MSRPAIRPAGALAPWAAALAAAVGLGCAPRSFVATPEDYAAYRPTRLAPTFDDRLAAADRYLTRHGSGDFAEEVRAYFDQAEPVYFAAKAGSIAGLEAYLRALPDGPHAAAARLQLKDLKARARPEDFSGDAAATQARLTRATTERARVREEVTAWVGRFLDAEIWKRPLSEAPSSVIVPWSLSLPAPVCAAPAPAPGASRPPAPSEGALRCAKLLELPYTVIVDGKPDAREATVEIAVLEDAAGRPVEVTLGGPDLFLRLEETHRVRALDHDDPTAGIDAIARAVDLLRSAFEERVSPDVTCRRPVTAPAVLDLACKGVRAVARAAVKGGDDDTITLRAQ